MCICTESNEELKFRFRKFHTTLVDSVNPASIIDFLFQEEVIGAGDIRALVKLDNPQQQSSDLLALLHTSEHSQAFIQLYLAIKEEPKLRWLIDRIDNFPDQSLIVLLQQMYNNEPTGE